MKRDWYVLHVRPRTEKKVQTYLVRYGYFHYLPLRKKTVRVQRRKRVTYLPLFPGYVFTRLLPDERLKMLQTNLLVNTILADNPRRLVHQLRQVEHALRAKPDLCPSGRTFHAGETVRVVSGPFRGLEGVVMRNPTDLQVVLNIDLLGQAVTLKISPSELEPGV